MALTAKQIKDLNKAMVANQRANLGNVISDLTDTQEAFNTQSVIRGTHVAVTDDATADKVDVVSGLTEIVGYQVQVFRAGVLVGGDVKVSANAGTLSIEDGTTYKITAGDIITYIIW